MPLTDIRNVAPEPNLWLISPHYDDIPLTFGGFLDTLVKSHAAEEKRLRMIHVFSRSIYQAHDDEGNRDTSLARIQYATGIRLMEDLSCLDDLLGFGRYAYEIKAERECVLRHKAWKAGEKFEFPHGNRSTFDREDWEIFSRIKGYARDWLTQKNTAILLLLCVKEHVDHVIIREAVMEARVELGPAATANLYFGEDQPYTGLADTRDWAVANQFVTQHRLAPIDYLMDLDRKEYVVKKHYPSQVDASYIEGIRSRSRQLSETHKMVGGVERIYRLRTRNDTVNR